MNDNRETWLIDACEHLQPWVRECTDAKEFTPPCISVGFPRGSRGRGHTLGQCWDKSVSGDGERSHIFIAPDQTDEQEILRIILHELIHASVGTRCGHRKEFRKVALELGFKPPMTSTPVGDVLKNRLANVATVLGAYPHPGLSYKDQKKPGSRLLKVDCSRCGCIIRMTNKWIQEVGTPTCGCGEPMYVEY